MAEFARAVTKFATNSETPLSEGERERFKRVLDYRWRMHRLYGYLNLDLDNLEHLFSLIEMAASLFPGDDDDPAALRDDLVFVLVKTLELTLNKEPGLEAAINPYRIAGNISEARQLAQDSRHHTTRYRQFTVGLRAHDTVLTFNYDTVLEDALLTDGVGPDYGFAEPVWKQTERAVPVLKLHGSVNFIYHGEDNIEIVDHELLDATTDRYFKNGVPLLVPPTWNKGPLGGVIGQTWTLAGQALRSASKIAFIGYSLPDIDLSFRYLLANSLAVNKNLLSIHVQDSSPATMKRYEDFLAPVLKDQGKFHRSQTRFEDTPGALLRP